MSPNNGENMINLNAVRAHNRNNRELDYTPQTSSRNSVRTGNTSNTKRPTPRRRPANSSEKRNVRNSYSHSARKYEASLKKNYIRITKAAAAGALAFTLALGSFAGYKISNHTNDNVDFSLDDYNPTDLFYGTNELVKDVAEDKLLEERPDMEDTLSDYYLESYNESSVNVFNASVTLQLNYINNDSRDTSKADLIPVRIELPKDFAKNVYLPYKELRDTSQAVTDKEKAKTSYWLKINKHTTDLTHGLETYMRETEDREYVATAQSILDKSRTTDDDEGR